MVRRVAGLTTLLAVTTFCAAQAQSRLALELRGGPAFPTADMGTPTLHIGAGFGAALSFQVLPALRIYAGWDWHHFAFDKPFSGNEYDAEDSGYTVCVQFQRQVAGALASWVRAGGIYNHIEVENPEGSIVADSGHELGWEVGVGLLVPIGSKLALMPGARYRTFSGNLDLGAGREPVDLSYLAVELGVSWSFGGRAVTLASGSH